ncbi:hypothetical protein Slala03_71740 [Streptomyces lavendulae subsp. lavendulae]|nr:hypothetical protein Slala03_71740 [Streptomyces lavendulae subsp. lavendulae]
MAANLREPFGSLDLDKDGFIPMDEWLTALRMKAETEGAKGRRLPPALTGSFPEPVRAGRRRQALPDSGVASGRAPQCGEGLPPPNSASLAVRRSPRGGGYLFCGVLRAVLRGMCSAAWEQALLPEVEPEGHERQRRNQEQNITAMEPPDAVAVTGSRWHGRCVPSLTRMGGRCSPTPGRCSPCG